MVLFMVIRSWMASCREKPCAIQVCTISMSQLAATSRSLIPVRCWSSSSLGGIILHQFPLDIVLVVDVSVADDLVDRGASIFEEQLLLFDHLLASERLDLLVSQRTIVVGDVAVVTFDQVELCDNRY